MACASSLLSEDKLLCSVCLDVFTKPVSTPCGHNFCISCIQTYWDSNDVCRCPLCNKKFNPRPQLQVNTVMSELAAEFKALAQVKESPTAEPQVVHEAAGVLCDICTDMKAVAVKSCLTCLASFCKTHLEPHQRVAGLKGHPLSEPVKNLSERMCKVHGKIEELYCRTDQACICVACFKASHKRHDVVPLEEEYEALVVKGDQTKKDIQKMIQSRSKKVAEIQKSLDACEKEAKLEKEAGLQVFTDLMASLLRRQAELVETIEERHRATKQRAKGFLSELEMEITELESRSRLLEELTQSRDHHHFLQRFPTISSPFGKDWTEISIRGDLSFASVRQAANALKQKADTITANLPEIRMKTMRKHAVDLTFDPDTAHCTLVISQDGKQLTHSRIEHSYPPHPKRFKMRADVLTWQCLPSKSYYEVQVKGNTQWLVGVARESVDRKKDERQSVRHGYWSIMLAYGTFYAYGDIIIPLEREKTLEKVGVFVDYKKREISFYDADSKEHLYSFTECRFKGKLYPYFSYQDNEDEENADSLIITPVQ